MTGIAEVVAWVTGLGGLAGVAAMVAVIWNMRTGVKADARQASAQEASNKRDTIADRDAQIDQLQEDGESYRAELRDMRTEIARITTLVRDQGADLEDERTYNRMLMDHIYRGSPPPPPPRPPRSARTA